MFITVLHARNLRVLATSACLMLLTACGGSSMSSSGMNNNPSGGGMTACGAATCGSAMLTMTDAKGDFLSYIVTLTSLQLQTANGTVVETLPNATKVDFAQLVDLTEVLSAGQISAANYVSATVTIDYSAATITADDGTGKGVALKPVDSNGNALTTTLSVSVQLDNRNHLIITPGLTSRLAFDFNLAASNTVDMTAGTVTVAPTLVATVVPSDTKQIRVRGSFASASTTQSDFVLNVQPFHNPKASSGQVTVDVSGTTTYQINGTAFVGAAGLTALAALPANTMIAAFGSLQTDNKTFTAAAVVAGASLENPADDQVTGTVIARSQNTLTVRGATWIHRDDDFQFEMKDATVTVAAGTGVTEEGQMGTFTINDISVGQIVSVFGTATQSNGALSVDAAAGQVQLKLTPAWGTVAAMATGSLTLNLQSLSGLAPSVFNFAGTGTAGKDASAAAYVVNSGTLAQTGLTMNAPARVIGFVAPFGSAGPNFNANTLVNFSQVADDLVVGWGRMGSATAFTGLTATSTSLQLSLANVGLPHVIQIGPQSLDLTTLATAPAIVPDATAKSDIFTIGHAGHFHTDNFSSFADFVTALSGDVTGSTTVVAVAAAGQYDSVKNTFASARVAVLLSN